MLDTYQEAIRRAVIEIKIKDLSESINRYESYKKEALSREALEDVYYWSGKISGVNEFISFLKNISEIIF